MARSVTHPEGLQHPDTMRFPPRHRPINPLHRQRPVAVPRTRRAGDAASVGLGCVFLFLAGAFFETHAETTPARLAPLTAEPTLRLTARGEFDKAAVRAGDTVRYRLRVEWTEVPATVMLLPRETLETPGFDAASLSTLQRKSVVDGTIRNVTEYVYALIPREAGRARVAPFTLRYHNGLTGREEGVAVAGSVLEIAPARKPLAQRTGIRVLAALVAMAVLVELLRRLQTHRRTRIQARSGGGPTPADSVRARDAEAVAALRRRCDTADSRLWVSEAERLSTTWLCRRLGLRNTENVRFEAALQEYLDRSPAPPPDEQASWSTLRDLYHESRYSGTRREPYELREACRHLTICLQLHGDHTP